MGSWEAQRTGAAPSRQCPFMNDEQPMTSLRFNDKKGIRHLSCGASRGHLSLS